MNIHAFSRSLAAATVLLAAPAMAEQFGPLEVVGFAKDEFSICDNCAGGLVNPSSYDPRGVLSPPDPMVNQPGVPRQTSHNLGLAQLTLGLAHEFDNAFKIEGKASGRVRNNGPDIYDNYVIDLYAGVSHPKYGSLQAGKMSSRSWTRTDSFAYPVGLSSPWAESGAGYGVFPEALRYATKEFEFPLGRVRFEATIARAKRRDPLNYDWLREQEELTGQTKIFARAPDPRLFEVFIQFSNEKNLVEAIYQDSTGGRQSSFSKGAFYGAQGDTMGPQAAPGYQTPTENVTILEGTYWHNDTWKVSYGLKRSEWSGQQQQCDFGPIDPTLVYSPPPPHTVTEGCFWDQAGFNYASDLKLHHAVEWDAMLGVAYTRRLWVYTLGGVRMNKAYVHTPTEWGQSNTATFLNFGIYRKLPEISSHIEVYTGLGKVIYGRQGPAPLSMPSNEAFGAVDPRVSWSGNFITLGMNINF